MTKNEQVMTPPLEARPCGLPLAGAVACITPWITPPGIHCLSISGTAPWPRPASRREAELTTYFIFIRIAEK
ncbi:hypothetical protein NQ318_006378 [Aromia moschata]|uniref:Uncharacterized protein n=1 Tax=Aromia moschata TaxID=1265417 RepID=A0AAV8YHX0_9CUCU|nr:hypothetical protein NQ318_006378 [Aromia moschata]